MWRVAVADMRFRRRRFVITVLATALVFAMTLLISGVTEGLRQQDRAIIDLFGADRWYVAHGASGPFTSTTPIEAARADEIAALPGVTRARPIVLFRSTVGGAADPHDVNVLAVPAGQFDADVVSDGRAPAAAGEIVVDRALEVDVDVGDVVMVAGRELTVVGEARGISYYFGTPTVVMTLADAQAAFFASLPLATAIVVDGVPESDVTGLREMTPDEVHADVKRPAERGNQTVQIINVLLWLAAIGIVGSIVYLSAIERIREFAVMKATGATNRSLLGGLMLQAVVLSVAAAIVAAVLARLIEPTFPFEVRTTAGAYVTLLVVAVVIGLAASASGLRRAVRVDPAVAFGAA
jgi:putative ABC transport system permease protein